MLCFFSLFTLLCTKSDTPYKYNYYTYIILKLYLYKNFADMPKLYLKVIYKM